MPARYRVQQFLRAATSWAQPEELGERARYLPPEAEELFGRMPRYDRRHALEVLKTLQQQGYEDPDLLAAALLHDVGKTAVGSGRIRLWHRVAVVLMHAWQPGLAEAVGRDEPGSWRRAFYVQQHHAALGAELARGAGCTEATVALIRHHEDPPPDAGDTALAALQAADSRN